MTTAAERLRFRRFLLTSEVGGGVEVFLGLRDLELYEECKTDKERRDYLTHQGWRNLFNGPAGKMLTKLCNSMGADRVKKAFTDKVQIEEIDV